MKKILCILIAVAFFLNGYSQLDSSINIFNDLRLNQWAKKSNVPAWQIDGYRAIIFNGDTLVRINSGIFQAEEAKVYANGSNMSSALQDAFDYTSIKWLSFGSDSSRTYVFNSSINAHGKTLEFKNGNKLSGTATIDSLTISASDYDKVFDTTLNFTNLKSVKGYITPQQFGAKCDGVSNDVGFFQKVHDIAAANNLECKIPAGTYYIGGDLILRNNGTLIGTVGAKIIKSQGTSFKYAGKADNVKITGLTIEMQALSGNADMFSLGDATVRSTGLIFKDNKIQAHRLNGTVLNIDNIESVTIQGNDIDSSYNKGLQVQNTSRVEITGNRITNSGRSGYNVQFGNSYINVHHNYGKGSAQNFDLFDGVFDLYGSHLGEAKNDNVIFESNYAETGDSAYQQKQNHTLYRFQGCDNLTVKNNIAVSTSDYLLYAFRFSNREGVNNVNVSASGNEIHIKRRKYGRLVSMEDVRNVTFIDYTIVIDSAAIETSTYDAFYLSAGTYVDTVQNVIVRGRINANGHRLFLFRNANNLKNLDVSGSTLNNVVDPVLGTSVVGATIENFKFIGGSITSTEPSRVLFINSDVKNAIVMGVSAQNAAVSRFVQFTSGWSGNALINNNQLNGRRAAEFGGGINPTSYTSSSSSFPVPDTAGIIFATRTSSNQTVSLPASSSINTGRIVTIVGLSGNSYSALVGTDTIRNKESGTYYYNGTAWVRIGGSSPGGTTDLTSINTRLDSLEVNDSIYVNQYRIGDSIYLAIQDSVFSVFAPLAYDSVYTPSYVSDVNVASYTLSALRYTVTDSSVHVWGQALLTPSSGALTRLTITPPISTTLPSLTNLSGGGSGLGSTTLVVAFISALATNGNITITVLPSGTEALTIHFSADYIIR